VSQKGRQSKNVSKNQEILVRLLPFLNDAVGSFEESEVEHERFALQLFA
jgi:hypothetical protein